MIKEPALGMIEFKSVARGIQATDAIVKKAPVKILETHPICPGKYMVLFAGEVADVEESLKIGLKVGGDLVINDLFLPYVDRNVIPAITGTNEIKKFGSLGIVETFSICSCVVAADIAAKATPVELIEVRLANGLGGKAYFVMTGELSDVQESTRAATEYVKKDGMLACSEVIADPHPDLLEKGVYW